MGVLCVAKQCDSKRRFDCDGWPSVQPSARSRRTHRRLLPLAAPVIITPLPRTALGITKAISGHGTTISSNVLVSATQLGAARPDLHFRRRHLQRSDGRLMTTWRLGIAPNATGDVFDVALVVHRLQRSQFAADRCGPKRGARRRHHRRLGLEYYWQRSVSWGTNAVAAIDTDGPSASRALRW